MSNDLLFDLNNIHLNDGHVPLNERKWQTGDRPITHFDETGDENFNCHNHPEMGDGEVFIANVDEQGFLLIKWQSKRRGTVAYNNHGVVIANPTLFPVFAKKEEIREKNPRALIKLLG